MYNIIIENDIKVLYRADSRSPNEIKAVGGFSMSRSIDDAGTLGKYNNGRVLEPIIYTASTYRGMRHFGEQSRTEKFYYEIDSTGYSVARYKTNTEKPAARRNLTLHLRQQAAFMEKVIGAGWQDKSDRELAQLLLVGCVPEPSWFDKTLDVEECHIIGAPHQLHAPQLFHTNGPFPIIVPLTRIKFVGTNQPLRLAMPEPLSR
ncbi:hypothetical protein AB1E22_17755 [Buttiauxella gaviniae]|uniref:Uncharacterized protein n=1 Tax=Buttiauxella gaviniae TaxID=82990 RepID=A0ABV3NYA4_9ENTR